MSILPDFSRQYQPPKIPTHWSADERRFAQGVTDVLDDIYLRYGRLSKKDLSPILSKEISDATGNITTIKETADGFSVRVESMEGDVASLMITSDIFGTRISDAEGNISTLEQTATSFGTRITNAEGDISTINQTVGGISSTVSSHTGQISAIDQKADNISLAVSQEKVWRAATENALNTALSAAGITKAAGLLWYDTTNNVVKRWTGTAWANTFVNTSQIVIDDDSIDIGTTGTLNLLSGGAINIKNHSGTDNVINMDNTGLTLSSTGKLKITSTDSIEIGGSPFDVGGTNLLESTSIEAPYATLTDSTTKLIKGSGQYYITMVNPMLPDTDYTLSVGGVTTGLSNQLIIIIVDATLSTVKYEFPAYVSSNTSITITSPSNLLLTDKILFYFAYDNTTSFEINELKLEKGTIATDWSPSPQDTVDALDALDGRLGDVETRVQVFYQASKPTYTAVGDLWYDTDSNPLEIWKCTNVSTQAHSAFTDPVLTRALSAQTTANSKITTFVGSSTPTALAAGDLWMDTGNKNIWKRATAAGTGGWVQYLTAAGYLITTGITIDGTDLTVKATGNLNLAADGNLNVQNGGNLNVLNGGDIEINNGGDINVASGGKINISATDLIISGKTVETYASEKIRLEVSVGGTNLIPNSGFGNGTTGWGIYSDPALSLSVTSESDNWPANTPAMKTSAASVVGQYTVFWSPSFAKGSIETDGYYTVSFWCSAYTSPTVYIAQDTSLTGGAKLTFAMTAVKIVYDTGREWFKYVGTAKATSADLSSYQFIVTGYAVNTQITKLCQVQLEKGTTATDWSPAPSDPASGVKTSKVTIDGTGIAMTTGGTFTTTSQNFNIDAAGNVVMKGTVEASAGKIGGFTISGNKLVDTATGGTKAQFDPTTGTLILNDLEITQESDRINFLSRFVSKLRYFDFSNPNGGFIFRSSSSANASWMTRFDIEMPTAGNPYGGTYNYGNSYIQGNCSAQSFTDRTPAYFGDALDELRWTSGSKANGIDHSSLPKFAQKTIVGTRINEDGEKEDYQEEGRDLGAMVSVLTRAVQQLADKVDSQQRLIEDLNRRVNA